MIDEVKLRKKDEEINYMLSEPLWKAWITFKPILVHVIQLLQCGLHMRCPIFFVKLLKIWFDFHHFCVQIKHGILPLLIGDIMCTCSPNTCTIPLKNWQLPQRNISDYMVPHCWCIHVVSTWEIHAWEVCNLFTREFLCNTPLNPYLVVNGIS
jgi:hypothetical protein